MVFLDEREAVVDFTKQQALDYRDEIRKGNIPGKSFVRITALTDDVGTTEKLVANFDTPYVYNEALTGESWRIKSTSADDSAAGTGIQEVTIKGINTSFAELDLFADLDGTNFVNIPASTHVFCQDMFASRGDFDAKAKGTITLETTGGNARSVIKTGHRHSSDGISLVPGNSTWALDSALPNAAKGKDGTFFLEATTGDDGIFLPIATITIYQGVASLPVSTIIIPPKSFVRVIGSSSNPLSFGLLELVFLQEVIS